MDSTTIIIETDFTKDAKHIFDTKFIILIDGINKKEMDNTFMFNTSCLIYRISITRTTDQETHCVWKRFKEIRSWFYQVL